MNKRNARAPSQRQLRVGEEIRHAIAHVLERGEIRDPDLAGVAITVTEVRVSPDLKNATAYVVPLGGLGDMAQLVEALNRISSFLRYRVVQDVKLRSAPRLSFLADTSFDEAGHINDLLHLPEVVRDLKGEDDNGA
ncbi:MAG: 30S ribosome-binding factor RbfA [Rhodospirillaceae bacterium]|nr:30S ribosome-binding factor RbfA [Rhodospirillaceae bacterium]MBL6942052.1 30S ribosome-binding factor RbfA [Rhodospirillales bacterium]